MPEYAKRLETARNELEEAGYAVQLNDQDDGTIIVGVDKGENPLAAFLAHMKARGAHPHALELSDRSKALLDRFFEASEEYVRESELHDKGHDGEEVCSLGEILRELSGLLKTAARANLQ
jgi:hypothetical protein